MTITKHSISISTERVGDSIFITFKAIGILTHEDYNTITPMIESALESVKHPNVKALFDLTELEGWDLRAAWDDFKIGLKHGNKFDKVALYGNKKWQEIATKVGSWFIPGEAKYFEDEQQAIEWLQS